MEYVTEIGSQKTSYQALVRKRAEGLLQLHRQNAQPHLVPFCGLELIISPEVFCPVYGEGSQLIAACLSQAKDEIVLELGTGSGALALLAANRGAARIIATDISPLAVTCAQENAIRLSLEQSVEIRLGDLFGPLEADERFSLIIFNPPFLEGKPKTLLEKAIYDEGHGTLTAFVRGLGTRLTDGGRALMAFSSAGDLKYLEALFQDEGLAVTVIDEFISDFRFLVYEIRQ